MASETPIDTVRASSGPLLLDTLVGVASALARPRPLLENIDQTLRLIVDALELDRAILRTPRADGALELVTQVGPVAHLHPAAQVVLPGKSQGHRAFAERQPAVDNEHAAGGRTERRISGHGLRSSAAFPLVYRDQCLGILGFGSMRTGFFTEPQVKFLTAIAKAYGALLHNAQLRDAMGRQLALAADRSGFIRLASHELRNPIAVISGYSELLLLSSRFSGEHRKWIADIQHEANRLTRIVADLMTLEWMRRAEELPKNEPLALRKLLEDVRSDIEATVTDATINIECSAGDPVSGDPERLYHVVHAVVDNAFKHGGGSPVTVAAATAAGWCTIDVHDNGDGLPEGFTVDDIAIFNRPDYQSSSHIRGLGLGLFVAKSYVESLGGELSIETNTSGTCVTMKFPLTANGSAEAAA